MLNPREISARHLPTLQTTLLKRRSVLDERRIEKLYKAAKALFTANASRPNPSQTMWQTKIATGEWTVCTCTDIETGLFIQLVGKQGCDGEDTCLTFGQKFCFDAVDAVRQLVVTKIW